MWISSLVILCLWLLDVPGEVMILVGCYALLFSFVGGMLGSLTVSVAFGIMAGIIGGFLLSLPIGIMGINEYVLDELSSAWQKILLSPLCLVFLTYRRHFLFKKVNQALFGQYC
jgi:hypothetical protein